jgi:hypothetical protein
MILSRYTDRTVNAKQTDAAVLIWSVITRLPRLPSLDPLLPPHLTTVPRSSLHTIRNPNSPVRLQTVLSFSKRVLFHSLTVFGVTAERICSPALLMDIPTFRNYFIMFIGTAAGRNPFINWMM